MAESNSVGPSAAKKYAPILIPVAGVVLLIVLVVVISDTGNAGRKMSDGSDGSADDSALKEISPGVKYRDLKEGEGEACPAGSEVTVHYTGWIKDGTIFDTTSEKGKPLAFKASELIPGWQEGIPGMKPGGIRKLVISPEKGYGSRAKGKIPANSTLIFEVELVEFKGPPKLMLDKNGKTLSDGTEPGASDPGLRSVGSGGLMVRDIKVGNGPEAPHGAHVEIYYTGWLMNGTVFDSSAQRGELADFDLGGLIPGWQQGIPGMKAGGVRKLVVPPSLGYGDRAQSKIPANSTLVFEVQLVGFK